MNQDSGSDESSDEDRDPEESDTKAGGGDVGREWWRSSGTP